MNEKIFNENTDKKFVQYKKKNFEIEQRYDTNFAALIYTE